MSGFYKMDPAAWDFGTAELSLEEEAAYLRIVNAIHKHDGPVPNNDRVLAGLFRCSTRKARALVEALLQAGKVVIEDGKIWNERARSELVHRQLASGSAALRGSKGGRTRAERASKPLESKEPPQASASSRIEENRIEEKRTPIGVPKNEPLEAFTAPEKPASRRRPEVPIPEAWVPSDRNIADAEARQFSALEIEHEADQFRNHHLAKGSRFSDWDAAWRTWLGNARKFAPRGMAGPTQAAGRGQGGGIAGIVARRRLGG